jgi:hypothetical protein
MHDSDPVDQLLFPEDPNTPALESNEQCLQCHPQFRGQDALVAHSHHEPDSSGSLCAGCHMPYQTFGIQRAHRAHRIQSPTPTVTARDSLPNGCNQCHVDRSLEWTATLLAEWQQGPAVSEAGDLYVGDRSELSEVLVQLGRGHALSRVIAVQMLGAEPGKLAAPGSWRAPFLIDALEDSYPVVRLNAYRSLRTLPGFEDLEFVYFSEPTLRAGQVAHAWVRWDGQVRDRLVEMGRPTGAELPGTIPLDSGGRPREEVRRRLLASRDNTRLNIAE